MDLISVKRSTDCGFPGDGAADVSMEMRLVEGGVGDGERLFWVAGGRGTDSSCWHGRQHTKLLNHKGMLVRRMHEELIVW